jgi:choline dehydrogenase
MTFDYIIVGAGAAGCVLADRLSADGRRQVLLLEVGGGDANPLLWIPKGFFFTLRSERYLYRYPTQPIGPGGQVETWLRGRLTGGSTAINGMMYTRGAAADYDAIERRGNPGWGWATMLPIFQAMEDHQLGASATRGAGGPYGVSITAEDDELTSAILAAAQQVGWRRTEDTNADDLRHTEVARLLFQGTRVVGVRTSPGRGGQDVGHGREYRASREVLLSAGTVESTLLLERSGIGRPDVLRAAGVEPRVESPNVGERVIEQRGVNYQVRLRGKVGLTERLNSVPKQGWQGLRYLATRRGPIATGGYDLLSAFKSSPDVARPDIQGIWVPMALDTGSSEMKLAKHSGFMFVGYPIRPTTEGSIHLSGPQPGDPPVINARFLETEADRAAAGTILGHARAVVAQSPLADLVLEEEYPGPGVSTPEQVVRYSLDTGAGLYHAIGAAAMGPDEDDVLDPELRVRGVSGLRVVDASAFRQQPSGNSAAPTMALAWRAAELIQAEHA